MDIALLPFNSFVGIQTKTIESATRVFVLPDENHLNHLATVHATVIYGVAEAATGHELVRRFPFLVDGHLGVLRESELKYRQPGQPGIEILGIPHIKESDAELFSKRLGDKTRATLEINVSVMQEENKLLEGRFKWFVQKL